MPKRARSNSPAENVPTTASVHGSGAAAAVDGVAGGQGAVVIGGNLYGNIFGAFAAASPSLADHIRIAEFQTLVLERTRNFVGRDFIFAAIDTALADAQFPSGYIQIRGEPGIGKTALMCELTRRRNYVHHFNIASQNIRSSAQFLENVCAQLVVRYELPHDQLPPAATHDSGFLSQLLNEASLKNPQSQIVILVDALDEVDNSNVVAAANRLYLPPTLPERVYFVVSTREMAEADYRLAADRLWEPIVIRQNDPRNEQDLQQYVKTYIEKYRHLISPQLTSWGVNEGVFVETLTSKSCGNFMYLVFVLDDIRSGRLGHDSIDDITQLPIGLRAYYQHHWSTMRDVDRDQFVSLYEPVLCTLAVVREPVTPQQIVEWARRLPQVSANLNSLRVREVIQQWRQFLTAVPTLDGDAYRVYHRSFADFLEAEVGLAGYDSLIGESALAKIPGFFPG